MDYVPTIKKPEKAPSISDLLKDRMEKVINLAISDKFKEIAKAVNKEYLYWDRFKYVSLPEGIEPDIAWFALKLTRKGATKTIPLEYQKDILFNYWMPDVALKLLHIIDQDASGHILVDDPVIHKKERDHYVINSIIEEAVTTSMLEGAATTRLKGKDLIKKGRKPKDRSEQMIINSFNTISKIKHFLSDALTPGLLTELQGLITNKTLENPDYEGRFRTETDGPLYVIDMTGQVLHEPPEAKKIPQLINQLCDFANNDDESEFIHPVIKGVILHFWLAYVHPFMDGNGRTSRALFYWYLLKKNYWLFEYLSISSIILKAPAQYYRAFLYSEIDDGDMTYFIRFHLRAISLAMKELRLYLSRKQKESLDASKQLASFPYLNYRQRALLTHALRNPDAVFTPRTHMQAHRVVYETARSDLLDLVKRGFLKKLRIGRGYSFMPVENLPELFNLHG